MPPTIKNEIITPVDKDKKPAPKVERKASDSAPQKNEGAKKEPEKVVTVDASGGVHARPSVKQAEAPQRPSFTAPAEKKPEPKDASGKLVSVDKTGSVHEQPTRRKSDDEPSLTADKVERKHQPTDARGAIDMPIPGLPAEHHVEFVPNSAPSSSRPLPPLALYLIFIRQPGGLEYVGYSDSEDGANTYVDSLHRQNRDGIRQEYVVQAAGEKVEVNV